MQRKSKVLVTRGHSANPWELAPWTKLAARFEVELLMSDSNDFDLEALPLKKRSARTLRGRLPGSAASALLTGALGDRYLDPDRAFAEVDIVHAGELCYWFSAQAAQQKRRQGFKLVQTVWETLPMLSAFRNRKAREFRELVLSETDLFLPTTERARDALLLEGVSAESIEICPPGIDVDRFSPGQAGDATRHTVVSPGRLVWEKGHHDVIRALAALRKGVVALPDGVEVPLLRLIGKGPEQKRLHQHAVELGVEDLVQIGAVPYNEMPNVFASASCMVLGSIPSAALELRPGGTPHAFWEEQFGMVIAEAMAAGLPLLLSASGAIPEVAGENATYFNAGDWIGIARALADGPLRKPPGTRERYPAELVELYSTDGMAGRLNSIYASLADA